MGYQTLACFQAMNRPRLPAFCLCRLAPVRACRHCGNSLQIAQLSPTSQVSAASALKRQISLTMPGRSLRQSQPSAAVCGQNQMPSMTPPACCAKRCIFYCAFRWLLHSEIFAADARLIEWPRPRCKTRFGEKGNRRPCCLQSVSIRRPRFNEIIAILVNHATSRSRIISFAKIFPDGL